MTSFSFKIRGKSPSARDRHPLSTFTASVQLHTGTVQPQASHGEKASKPFPSCHLRIFLPKNHMLMRGSTLPSVPLSAPQGAALAGHRREGCVPLDEHWLQVSASPFSTLCPLCFPTWENKSTFTSVEIRLKHNQSSQTRKLSRRAPISIPKGSLRD